MSLNRREMTKKKNEKVENRIVQIALAQSIFLYKLILRKTKELFMKSRRLVIIMQHW